MEENNDEYDERANETFKIMKSFPIKNLLQGLVGNQAKALSDTFNKINEKIDNIDKKLDELLEYIKRT